MAWVAVHDEVIGSKLRELAKEIDSTQEEALGILTSLWLWGKNNADKDGRLISADRDDVLEAFSLKLVSSLKVDLVDSLIKTRWMDEPEPGILYIHDWDQWQEQWYKAIERREKDAKRKAASRKIKKAGNLDGKPDHKMADNRSRQPAEALHDPPVEPAPTEEQKYVPAFEEFWQA